MRNGTPKISSLQRTLETLESVVTGTPGRNISAIARDLGLPVATAHRQIATLTAEGYLARHPDGSWMVGPKMLRLLSHVDERDIVARLAQPILKQLARRVRTTVHLGTFDEDMVTYRAKAGGELTDLFTQVGMQLEAYCSAIGKVLLAHMRPEQLDTYLLSAPFVALTAKTIVDVDRLREEIGIVRASGHAVDDEEIATGLKCIAVPIAGQDREPIAAISISWPDAARQARSDEDALVLLRAAAHEIATTWRDWQDAGPA
ncbi:hypothetical protein HY78_28990 (plasmid) [Rhizorhabdus wittichii DC-6]|nr:hypothetical protein HY78_28990 [Rhizorhabdus wittichii DC-6]